MVLLVMVVVVLVVVGLARAPCLELTHSSGCKLDSTGVPLLCKLNRTEASLRALIH